MAECNETQGRGQHQDVVDVEEGKEVFVLTEDVESEQRCDDGQGNGGGVVVLEEMPPAAFFGSITMNTFANMGGSTDGGGDNAFFCHVFACEGFNHPAPRHDDDLVTQAFKFCGIR